MSDFFDDFNVGSEEAQEVFHEDFQLRGGVTVTAVAIDSLEYTKTVALGGQMVQATVSVTVFKSKVDSYGIKKGDYLKVRGVDVKILELTDDGDSTITFLCGPMTVRSF